MRIIRKKSQRKIPKTKQDLSKTPTTKKLYSLMVHLANIQQLWSCLNGFGTKEA